MDEKKSRQVKILVLVVLGGLCVGLAVPRFLNLGPTKATPEKKPTGKVDATKIAATTKSIDTTTKVGKGLEGTPKIDPFPVPVGQEIVKDPFTPAYLSGLGIDQPPSTNPPAGSERNLGNRSYPWDNMPTNDVRPPVLVADGTGLGHVGPTGTSGETPPQVNKGPGYQLTGVIRGVDTIAIIRCDSARYYAKVGDSLGGGYSVKSISGDRVTLSGPSGTQVLFVGRS